MRKVAAIIMPALAVLATVDSTPALASVSPVEKGKTYAGYWYTYVSPGYRFNPSFDRFPIKFKSSSDGRHVTGFDLRETILPCKPAFGQPPDPKCGKAMPPVPGQETYEMVPEGRWSATRNSGGAMGIPDDPNDPMCHQEGWQGHCGIVGAPVKDRVIPIRSGAFSVTFYFGDRNSTIYGRRFSTFGKVTITGKFLSKGRVTGLITMHLIGWSASGVSSGGTRYTIGGK